MTRAPMAGDAAPSIALVTFLVHEYDEAIGFFTRSLGFDVIEDTPLGDGKRWVVVGSPTPSSLSLLLGRAATPEQARQVGHQAGGRVFLFLHSADFDRDHARMEAAGVRFVETPRDEPYGKVVVFLDLYGNKWDLVQRRSA